jgi:hypothetical protein
VAVDGPCFCRALQQREKQLFQRRALFLLLFFFFFPPLPVIVREFVCGTVFLFLRILQPFFQQRRFFFQGAAGGPTPIPFPRPLQHRGLQL